MNKRQKSGSGIFLMELIAVVFFFIICASVCMLAFAKADRLSRLAADRNQAVLMAESTAEVWKLNGEDGVKTLWKEEEMAEFQVEFQIISEENGLETAEISVIRSFDKELLFSLETSRYVRPALYKTRIMQND